jgi:Fur family transcriptional regulator, iron response regulator
MVGQFGGTNGASGPKQRNNFTQLRRRHAGSRTPRRAPCGARHKAGAAAPVRQRRSVCGTIKAMEFQGITRELLADLLRSHGIAPTHQRIEIAHVLFERKQHLSAEQILAAVNARHAETSKATVYNTLRLFLEKKLVRELIVDPTRVFYDPNTAPHHHFYDVVTGSLTDIPAEAVRITDLPALPPGTVADGVDIIIRTRPA